VAFKSCLRCLRDDLGKCLRALVTFVLTCLDVSWRPRTGSFLIVARRRSLRRPFSIISRRIHRLSRRSRAFNRLRRFPAYPARLVSRSCVLASIGPGAFWDAVDFTWFVHFMVQVV
jgi:hypothetical protein